MEPSSGAAKLKPQARGCVGAGIPCQQLPSPDSRVMEVIPHQGLTPSRSPPPCVPGVQRRFSLPWWEGRNLAPSSLRPPSWESSCPTQTDRQGGRRPKSLLPPTSSPEAWASPTEGNLVLGRMCLPGPLSVPGRSLLRRTAWGSQKQSLASFLSV